MLDVFGLDYKEIFDYDPSTFRINRMTLNPNKLREICKKYSCNNLKE